MKTLDSIFRRFAEEHPRDAARALEDLDDQEAAKLLDKLPVRLNGLLMERLTPQKAGAVLDHIDSVRAKELLVSLPPRHASMIIHHLEEGKRESWLTAIPDSMARQLRELTQYPEDTAGGMMEPRVTSVSSDLSVQAAIAGLRKAPRVKHSIISM